ncbi:MAG: epoxyqueuosine reductase [Candidatus Firestonebacteria bacterium]|nr:epoxyqueuosine reductase [Candidatus Firestonebacteria bacterium]
MQKENLKEIAKNEGCILFGIADITEIKSSFNIEPKVVLTGLNRAVSLGYVLSAPILATNIESPSKLYAQHYKKINILLDVASLKIASCLHQSGFIAMPIPASQLLDWKNFSAHLSHRKIAYLAGLGWLGKNNLLVNPDFGAHVRYISILTDAPLIPDAPLGNKCPPGCLKCITSCPANAIGESPEQFNLSRCLEKLTIFSREPGIGQHICGICVNACNGST